MPSTTLSTSWLLVRVPGRFCLLVPTFYSDRLLIVPRNKLTFIAWSPDDAPIMAKMVYASSKEALRRALTGIATEIQANDSDDIEYETVLKTVSKGQA